MKILNVTELAADWERRIYAPCQNISGFDQVKQINVICGSGARYDCHDPTTQFFQHRYKGFPRINYLKELKESLEKFPVIMDPDGPIIQAPLDLPKSIYKLEDKDPVKG